MIALWSSGATSAPARHVYVAPRLEGSRLVIDGDLGKAEWQAVPWSTPFDEIRGVVDAPEGTRPSDACRTRMKMLWDDEFLYIGAMLESDVAVVASFTERNSPIFQKDTDFEVFIDAAGSCHCYKELEINALNVVWNLLLTRPYSNGGGEHSGRVAQPGAPCYYEVAAQRTATRLLSGALGDPTGATWSVEIALAHSDTLARQPGVRAPAVGTRWRINFSRVERCGEVNWTWQPQTVWEPRERRYVGKVNMHLPDAWGLVEFGAMDTSAAGQSQPGAPSPSDAAHAAAFQLYYAQLMHRDLHGSFAPSVRALSDSGLLVEADLVPCELGIATDAQALAIGAPYEPEPEASEPEPGTVFVATAFDPSTGHSVSVRHDRLVVTRAPGSLV